MTQSVIIGILMPFVGTMLGSAFVFFIRKEMPALLQKGLLGIASGVMTAAAVWSLLIPSMEKGGVWPATGGFLCGMGLLLLIDKITPHLHAQGNEHEGPQARISRTAKIALAVAIHNFPEGMAVGAVLYGAAQPTMDVSVVGALVVSLGITFQNVPEGVIVSMPMRMAGNSRMRSFLIGTLSGAAEPLGALLVFFLASLLTPALPFLLAFAAGAMMYVVVEELIPEASSHPHSNVATIGFAVGFVLMMAMDALFG